MYTNGIQIYVTGFSDEYPTTPIENERVENESQSSYTLPVRLMYWAPDEFVEPEIYPDSIIQIPGDGLNWQQILVDVESNKAELEWSLVNVYIEAHNNYDFYFDYQGHYDDDDNDIIEDIPLEDFDFRGPPPAARSAVYNLERMTIGESRDFLCCICQAILLGGEKCVKMPCSHEYHEGCILQWLATSNSCPACKYELLTDDPDYEAQKLRRNS
ncbi:hypothetical protein SUGI_0465260 [Cryptomeria japonica]|nr:hypothetical protein SUGI_0465260 [Cryptomeria japonica]